MGAVLTAIGSAIVGSLSALFGSWKAFLGSWLLKLCLAVVLYNLVVEILDEVLQWVVGKLGGVTLPGGSVTSFDAAGISSLGAWLISTLKVPECFAFIISVIVLKWALRKIPFVRW